MCSFVFFFFHVPLPALKTNRTACTQADLWMERRGNQPVLCPSAGADLRLQPTGGTA